MQSIKFKHGAIVVTDNLFKTARRTYKIANIEKITMKRPLFWLSLPLAFACFMTLQEYMAYLYVYERVICLAMSTVVPAVSWLVVSLSVSSKSYHNDVATIGFYPVMKKTRAAIEEVIFSQMDDIVNRH